MALIAPARAVPEVEIAAVAARERSRAERFARKHRIPRVHDGYEALIADESLDAIYNPLPNSHHCEWTIRALEAGKHVLCEKPLASNADEARAMTEAAERHGRILMEAFHWRYHPVTRFVSETLAGGGLGRVEHVEAAFCVPMLAPGNIRYRLDLAGGATMDLGAYTVNMIRTFAGDEPTVVSARARESSPGVDRFMRAELAFANGSTARMTVSLCSLALLRLSCVVRCARGSIRIFNPIAPHVYHRVTVRGPDERAVHRLRGEPTYTGQLRAFVDSVRSGRSPVTDGPDGVRNMAVIDAIYEQAGLSPRGRVAESAREGA